MPSKNKDHLVWIDLEMTGLNPETDTILEIATLITTNTLEIVAEGPVLAVHQPGHLLDAMDDWNREHHSASGLVDRVMASAYSMSDVENRSLAFIREWSPKRGSPLCGNSVCQDRRFLARLMPALEAHLHYRNLDVSTVKELVRRWWPDGVQPPEKKHAHLALDDIRESVEELRFYRQHYFIA